MTEDQREAWRRAFAARAAQQRRQRPRPRQGLAAASGPGMVRVLPPDRAAAVARVVRVAIATTPSLATARRTIGQWAGHPADPAMKADALAMLDRIEAEAKETSPPAETGPAQEGSK